MLAIVLLLLGLQQTLSSTPSGDALFCEDNYLNDVQQFHLDGILLANYTLTKRLKDGTDFNFSNYFELVDFKTAKTMYTAIDDFLWKLDHQLWFLCASPYFDIEPIACHNDENLFVYADPDARPYGNLVPQPERAASGFAFCPSFFVPTEEYSHAHWYNKTTDEWCQATSVEEFMASGYHAMSLFKQTHKFGSIANLPLRTNDHSMAGLHPRENTAGAVSLVGPKPWEYARLIKQQWRLAAHGAPSPTVQRRQIADSYAAAALEWYYMVFCEKDKSFSLPV